MHVEAGGVSGEVTVIQVKGRVDAVSAPALEQNLRTALAAGHRRLVFDVGALDYISSAGLRVFMMAARELRGNGALAVAAPNDQIRQVLDLAGVAIFAKVYGTTAEAIAGLS